MSSSFLSVLIQRQAGKYGDRVALRYRDYKTETWIPVSWNQFAATVKTVSNALIELGIGIQENIAVFSQNKPECLYVDFGAFGVRAVTVPFYATSSEAQVHYMVGDAEIRYIFVGEQLQYDVAFRVMHNGDLANILYTSGTTGDSKGVMLHHSCYEAAIPAHDERFPQLGDQDVIMNFLPFTHVFERAWTCWCLSMGCTLSINLRPADIQKTIKEIRPTAMCSVPRFWEKVYAGVQEKINETTGLKKKLMLDAIKVGREHNLEYVYKGLTPPPVLHMKYKFYEKTIYSLLKKTIGIENGRFFPTAGAAIPPAVQEFVLSVGINMVAGYGLTESTATVACENDNDHVVGSVGRIMPHVQVRIGENNEIMLRGEGITHGYYKKEAATKAAFTEDGWFHTGDAGYIKDGHLFLTERIKDLFKTSNGKYIAPQAIEAKLVVDRYIDQISIIADERKFVSALIIPEYKLVKEYAAKKGIRYESMEELFKNSQDDNNRATERRKRTYCGT